jgi:hypothetical protein
VLNEQSGRVATSNASAAAANRPQKKKSPRTCGHRIGRTYKHAHAATRTWDDLLLESVCQPCHLHRQLSAIQPRRLSILFADNGSRPRRVGGADVHFTRAALPRGALTWRLRGCTTRSGWTRSFGINGHRYCTTFSSLLLLNGHPGLYFRIATKTSKNKQNMR